MSTKNSRRAKIKLRVRRSVLGNSTRPRLSVFRSNKQIYAQLIDDANGQTLAAASSAEKSISAKKANKSDKAKLVGIAIAEKAKSKGITTVRFDRNGFLYHGRVKSLADGAREGGLKF